jgi:ABC-2 type transport system permease protein
VWWLVLKRELAELWLGGRALSLLILFSVLMSITAFLLATNTELSLTPPPLTIVTTLEAALTFGLFIGLVVAAESVSGERERATLEPLLLTPANRREIVFGKYIASLSPWPMAILLAIPYVALLSQRDPTLGPALLWAAIAGTLAAAAFTGIGLLASIWSATNRTSLFVSLVIYFLALLPAQLPGEFLLTPAGAVIQAFVPLEAARQFVHQFIVDGKALSEALPLLISPLIAVVVVVSLMLGYAGPRLALEGGVVTGLGRQRRREASR